MSLSLFILSLSHTTPNLNHMARVERVPRDMDTDTEMMRDTATDMEARVAREDITLALS